MLYESDTSIYDQLVVARNELSDLTRIDSYFTELHDEIKSAEIIVSEVTNMLQDYNARIEFNPTRLEEIRERMGELNYLKMKYGGTLEAVLDHRRDIGSTYDLAVNFEGAIDRLDQQIEKVRGRLSDMAVRLSSKRRDVAQRIEQAIGSELAALGIAHGQLEVRFKQQPDPTGWILLTGGTEGPVRYAAFPDGMDQVEFYISTNVGESPKPLARVASGGEISRIMLALKTILAKSDRLPILVFDEIDAGISGAIAQRVGQSMKNLALYHQIIAITHLPQIAAMGDAHYVVKKRIKDGRTKTLIQHLDESQRAAEIASLLSGTEVTPAALESAKELIAAGREE
jgi:DNA repair protein RecN (Recombination protein N)